MTSKIKLTDIQNTTVREIVALTQGGDEEWIDGAPYNLRTLRALERMDLLQMMTRPGGGGVQVRPTGRARHFANNGHSETDIDEGDVCRVAGCEELRLLDGGRLLEYCEAHQAQRSQAVAQRIRPVPHSNGNGHHNTAPAPAGGVSADCGDDCRSARVLNVMRQRSSKLGEIIDQLLSAEALLDDIPS